MMKKPEGGRKMYVELLARALDDWVNDTDHMDLIEHALVCRTRMMLRAPQGAANVYDALAAEISYDRALIKLARAHCLYASAADFSRPEEERRRLESSLLSLGFDLSELKRGDLRGCSSSASRRRPLRCDFSC